MTIYMYIGHDDVKLSCLYTRYKYLLSNIIILFTSSWIKRPHWEEIIEIRVGISCFKFIVRQRQNVEWNWCNSVTTSHLYADDRGRGGSFRKEDNTGRTGTRWLRIIQNFEVNSKSCRKWETQVVIGGMEIDNNLTILVLWGKREREKRELE